MNAGRFATQRDRIASEQGRSNAWRKRAMASLVRRSGAQTNQAVGGKLISWSLPGGRTVCVKKRYAREDQATAAIAEMHREHDGRRKPIRAYPCFHCLGWHVTSMSRDVA
jgi:hypothetical protein